MNYLYLLIPQLVSLLSALITFVVFFRVQTAFKRGNIQHVAPSNVFLLHYSINGIIKQICGISIILILSFTSANCNNNSVLVFLGYLYIQELLSQIGLHLSMINYVFGNVSLDTITDIISPLQYIRKNKILQKINLCSSLWTGICYVVYNGTNDSQSKDDWCYLGTSFINQGTKYSLVLWIMLLCIPIWFSFFYLLFFSYKVHRLSVDDIFNSVNPYGFNANLETIKNNKKNIVNQYLVHHLEFLIIYILPTFAIFGGGHAYTSTKESTSLTITNMSNFQYFCIFLLQCSSIINLFLYMKEPQIQSLFCRKRNVGTNSVNSNLSWAENEMTNIPSASISSFS